MIKCIEPVTRNGCGEDAARMMLKFITVGFARCVIYLSRVFRFSHILFIQMITILGTYLKAVTAERLYEHIAFAGRK